MLFPLHFNGATGTRLDNAIGSGSYQWFITDAPNPTANTAGRSVGSEDRYTVLSTDVGYIRVIASFSNGSIHSAWMPIGTTPSGAPLSETVILASSGNLSNPRVNDTLTASFANPVPNVQWLWFSGDMQVGIGASYHVRSSDHGMPLRVIAVSSAHSDYARIETNAVQEAAVPQRLLSGSLTVRNIDRPAEPNPRIGDRIEVRYTPDPPTADISAWGAMRVRWISGTEVVQSAHDAPIFTVRSDDLNRSLMAHVWFDIHDRRYPLSAQAGFVGDGGTLAPLGGNVILSSTGDPNNPKVGDILSATLTNANIPPALPVLWSWESVTVIRADAAQTRLGNTYTVQHSDRGIRLRATPHAAGFNSAGVYATTVNAVARHDLAGDIFIDNVSRPGQTPRINDTLAVRYEPNPTANNAANGSGERFIRWSSGGTAVPGRDNAAVYLLEEPFDLNQTITVRLWFADQNEASAKTVSVGPVERPLSVLLPLGGTASISNSGVAGQPRLGDTLTATLTGHNASASSPIIIWEWMRLTSRGAVRVIRASGSDTYTVSASDVGYIFSARPHVAGYDSANTTILNSARIGRYDLAGSIVIDNTTRPNEAPRVRDTLAIRYVPDANAAHLGNGTGAVSIRWTSGGTAISTADNSYSYIVQDADVGQAIGVTLSFADQASEVITTSATVTGDVPHLLMLGGTVTIVSNGNLADPRIGDTLTATLTGQHADAVGLSIVWEWRREPIIRTVAVAPAPRTINSANYVVSPADIDFRLRAIPHVTGFNNAGVSAIIPNVVGRNPVPVGTVIVDNLQTGMNDIVRRETPLVGHILRARYIRSGPFDLHPMEDPPVFTWWGQPPTPVGGTAPARIQLGTGDAYRITQNDWNRGLRITVEVEFATRAGVVASREVRMPPVFVHNAIASTVFNGIGAARAMAAAYGNGIFLLGSNLGRIAVSTDNGETWTGVPVGLGAAQSGFLATEEVNTITFGNGLFIATGGAGNTGRINRSVNGLAWTQVPVGTATGTTTTFGTAPTYANGYGNGIYVVGGNTNRMAWSPAGASNWTAILPGTGAGQSGLANSGTPVITMIHHTGTAFIAGANAARMSRSTDGRNWTSIPAGTGAGQNTFPITLTYIWGIASANNTVIATSDSGRMARSINDGLSWTAIPAGTTANSGQSGVVSTSAIHRLIHTNGIFIAGAGNGSMSWSVDNGVNWIPIPAGNNPGQSNFTSAVWNFAANDADGWIVAIGTGGRVAMAHWPDWP